MSQFFNAYSYTKKILKRIFLQISQNKIHQALYELINTFDWSSQLYYSYCKNKVTCECQYITTLCMLTLMLLSLEHMWTECNPAALFRKKNKLAFN
jgi:hypothetical protein